jgi:hypothetical protein
MLEPAIWCLRRAGRYLEAIECCRNEQAVTAAHCEFDDDIANAVAAGLEFDIAECWYREKERSGDPAALRRAIEALRNAADLQRRHYPHSWAARRCDSLAGDLERTGMCELAVPVDTTPGDVLLVHNRYDVMAADLIRAHFVELGKRCTSTGPADPRDLVDLESTYRWIIVFGSLVAVGMERFSYLFQGESEIWHLQPHLGESQATKASWWARPKVNGKGRWFLVAGYTRFATVVATDKLRREWGREEASDNRKDWAASPDS